MGSVYINIRVPEELKKRADASAKKAGIGFSQFVREALHLYSHFSHPAFMQSVRHIAELYGVGESMVIQNVLLRYAAEDIAAEKVFGAEEELPSVPEFRRTRTGTKTGEPLLNELVEIFTEKFEVEKKLAKTIEKERAKMSVEKSQGKKK